MLTFLIPLLLGTILGFLIRGKPSDTFAITTGRRVVWGVGIALGGVAIGTPIGLSISSTTGPQIAGLIGAGLGLGVFNILSIENATYKKWSDKNALAWLVGGVVGVGVVWFVLSKQIPDFSEGADNASASSAEVPPDQPVRVTEVPNTYLGISLGDSEQQVRYVLGEPTRVGEKGDLKLLVYGNDDDSSVASYGILIARKRSGVIQIACQGEGCPRLLGVSIGDTEERVKIMVGEKATEKLVEGNGVTSASGVMKQITLREKFAAIFSLTKQKVILITLFDEDWEKG